MTEAAAVVAHTGKSFGGGLLELREELARRGVPDPIWLEVEKSEQAPPRVEQALERGAELIFVWGGDGMVQRCIDTVAGSSAKLAIIPAGTANLFASYLGIPKDIHDAVEIGLHGGRRSLDVGRFNGERFGVMAGAGFDAAMIDGADGSLKDRLGRASYLRTGAKSLREKPFKANVRVDGTSWYDGSASCILIGNIGRLFGGVEVFEHASPEDGRLDIGIVNADGLGDWLRTLAHAAAGRPEKSQFVRVASGRDIRVKLDRKVLYEIDGGSREKVKSFKVKVEPRAVTVCVPQA